MNIRFQVLLAQQEARDSDVELLEDLAMFMKISSYISVLQERPQCRDSMNNILGLIYRISTSMVKDKQGA